MCYYFGKSRMVAAAREALLAEETDSDQVISGSRAHDKKSPDEKNTVREQEKPRPA